MDLSSTLCLLYRQFCNKINKRNARERYQVRAQKKTTTKRVICRSPMFVSVQHGHQSHTICQKELTISLRPVITKQDYSTVTLDH